MNGKALDINLSAIAGDQISLDIEQLRQTGKIFLQNSGATIWDTGNGIGLIEFHTKANALNDDICEIILECCQKASELFKGLVIGNAGKHFSAGANLALILETARSGKWTTIENTILSLQRANMALKLCAVPVVAAPFSSALGGGCEVCLHASFVMAASETHMGLVEAGVGLIPAGGGTKELTVRAFDKALSDKVSPEQLLIQVAQNILHAKVSRNGTEAREVFLTGKDMIAETSLSPTGVAKIAALELSGDYSPKVMRNDIPVLGRSAFSSFDEKIRLALEAESITEHDALIAEHLANIICGGQNKGLASEQHFLDLERQAFLSLLGTAKTQDRIAYLLANNKPLHN